MAGLRAKLTEDGLSTSGSAAELVARRAEHGHGWSAASMKADMKGEPGIQSSASSGIDLDFI
jgi:hypothetical protein